MPHNLEAELAVIGSMIMYRDAIVTASEVITGEDFYNKHITFIERIQFCAKIKMLRGDVIEITRWKDTYPASCRRIFTLAKQFSLAYRLAFMILNLCPTGLAIATARLLGKNAE